MSYLEVITPYLSQIDTPEAKLDSVVFDEALSKLEPIVEQMLRGDMNLVFNILYRLDIAEAILQREIIRKIFRLKYSQQ
jgi:hypothetical protein